MKLSLVTLAFTTLLAFQTVANEFEANKHINLTICLASNNNSLLGLCASDQILNCEENANLRDDGYHTSRECSHEAAKQSDDLLNMLYAEFLSVAQATDDEWASPAGNRVESLRSSQRTWIELRDSSCVLAPNFHAINSGYDSVVARCQAIFTMDRLGFLRNIYLW